MLRRREMRHMADDFEHFNPGVRHPGGERLGQVCVLRWWLGPGGDGSEKNEDQTRVICDKACPLLPQR